VAKFPDSILEKATITLTSSGYRQAIINADTLYIFEKQDSTLASNVKINFFNEKGEYQSTLTARQGLVRQKREAFSVWGDVVVQNDTSKLETQSLHWDTHRNLITTDDFVKFTRGGDVITGYGLESDSRLNNVRILRDVKGRITNIPKTEQGLDSLETPKKKEQIP
jgi:LPS export ABC transporter protein LptC